MSSRLLWLSFLPLLGWSQSYTSTVRGTVTDSQQAAMPAAMVIATETNRNVTHTTKADNAGRYTLTALPHGSYTLSVQASGFQKYEKPPFQLEVQQEATVYIQLSVAGTSTTVEVHGTTELLNTANATLAHGPLQRQLGT